MINVANELNVVNLMNATNDVMTNDVMTNDVMTNDVMTNFASKVARLSVRLHFLV